MAAVADDHAPRTEAFAARAKGKVAATGGASARTRLVGAKEAAPAPTAAPGKDAAHRQEEQVAKRLARRALGGRVDLTIVTNNQAAARAVLQRFALGRKEKAVAPSLGATAAKTAEGGEVIVVRVPVKKLAALVRELQAVGKVAFAPTAGAEAARAQAKVPAGRAGAEREVRLRARVMQEK